MPALRWNIEDPEHPIYRKGNDMKHSPATALPWVVLRDSPSAIRDHSGNNVAPEVSNNSDADFIVHAANAYGPLVEALKAAASFLEDDSRSPRRKQACLEEFRSLLRSLGEAE